MIHRRQLIGGSLGGFFAFASRHQVAHLFAETESQTSSCRQLAKRCIVLWMEGGPSQLDTFDPKPGTANGGPVQAIKTTGEVQISEYLPAVASQMRNLAVIRNLTSSEGDHLRARYYLHTGFTFVPTFPRPGLGSIISHAAPKSDVPKYVTLGGSGFGPAYLGSDHAPFTIENPEQARELLKNIRQRSGRLSLLRDLDQPFQNTQNDPRLEMRRALMERIESLASTGFADALSTDQFSQQELGRYGNNDFGRRCLIARKLLDAGVRFVEVQLGGWDTHQNNFSSVKRLCQQIDRPFAALVEDLKSSGLYNDTLIVWMGEFGRTPGINGRNGRDHFPTVTPVVLGGGPIQTGFAIGQTDPNGQSIVGKSFQVADLFATILTAFGVAPDKQYRTEFDSPTEATDNGMVIDSLIG